jgi:hypothetical protein
MTLLGYHQSSMTILQCRVLTLSIIGSTISLDFSFILHFLLISSVALKQPLPPPNITGLDYFLLLLKIETIRHYHLKMASLHSIKQIQL